MTSTPRRASTPIRGVSSGSISARPHGDDASTPLSFLQEQALPILVEETAALHDNFAQLAEIQHAMSTFNESFAAFLYGIKMNAFCVEWPEAPTEESLRNLNRPASAPVLPTRPIDEVGDQTYMTDPETDEVSAPAPTQRPKSASRPSQPTKPAQSTAQRPQRPSQPVQRPRRPTQPSSQTRIRSQPGSASSSTTSKPAPAKASLPKRLPLAVQKKRAVRCAHLLMQAFADDILDTMPLDYRQGDPVCANCTHIRNNALLYITLCLRFWRMRTEFEVRRHYLMLSGGRRTIA